MRILPLGFLGVIALGTVLLMLPAATESGEAPPFLTALFTSTSAVCVTGLVVVDTPAYWSSFGEGVIAMLIQVGGFGIMTFASLMGFLVLGRLRLRNTLAAQAETKTMQLGDVRRVLASVGLITLAIESAVAAILTVRFATTYGYETDHALWHGVFHSISAFNNAGFALYDDSLEGFATDGVVTLPISAAIVIGGIGFAVIAEILQHRRRPRKWSIHTKITVAGTGILLAVGFFFYLVLEWNNTLAGFDMGEKVLTSFVSSVMPRTAGFNVLPMGDLETQTWAVTDVLMFIGGGSGGTAGGIKVTTFFLLAFVIWSELRGEPDVPAFRRTIHPQVVRQATTVTLLGFGLVAIGTFTLLSATSHSLDEVLFEAISAFGTVGLSTGITDDLGPVGEVMVTIMMYLGRVGTITVGAALALRVRPRRYRFPNERPIVG